MGRPSTRRRILAELPIENGDRTFCRKTCSLNNSTSARVSDDRRKRVRPSNGAPYHAPHRCAAAGYAYCLPVVEEVLRSECQSILAQHSAKSSNASRQPDSSWLYPSDPNGTRPSVRMIGKPTARLRLG